MAYQVAIAPSAQRDFKRLSHEVIRRVDAAILSLEENPRLSGCVKLEGSDSDYRVRVGDYRILYEVNDAKKFVTIAHVRKRSDAYRRW